MDIRIFCCLFVVYIYVRLVMSSYLLFCCIYFDAWCITCYPKREGTLEVYSDGVYLLYFDAWCITCCWGISARFGGGGVRFHTDVFLIQNILHKDKTYNTRGRFLVKLSINNHIVGLLIVHKKHIMRTCLMYHATCEVEFQPFKRSYSQLTFCNIFMS